MSESILDLERATEAPALPQKLHSCGGIQQEAGGGAEPRIHRGPSGCHTAKGQEEKNPYPQHPASQSLVRAELASRQCEICFLFCIISF